MLLQHKQQALVLQSELQKNQKRKVDPAFWRYCSNTCATTPSVAVGFTATSGIA